MGSLAALHPECWFGNLKPEICCVAPVGNSICFPEWDVIHTYAYCCGLEDTIASVEASANVDSSWQRVCLECGQPLGSWWITRARKLLEWDRENVSVRMNMVVARGFCKEGLRRLKSIGLRNPLQQPQLLGDVGCVAGITTLLVTCAVVHQDAIEHSHELFVLGIRILEIAAHCYDSSEWPFLTSEILDSFERFTETNGKATWLSPRSPLFSVFSVSGETLHAAPYQRETATNLREIIYKIRWSLGVWDASVYWLPKLDEASKRNTWLQWGQKWAHVDICAELDSSSKRQSGWRVLNAGSGPFIPPQRWQCAPDRTVELVSIDAHARLYRALANRLGVDPANGFPHSCPMEDLWREFPEGYFDFVYCRNALDHTIHPLEGMRMMLHVLRLGGTLLLWHLQDVKLEEWSSLSSGQHQWGFGLDTLGQHFIVHNVEHRFDATQWLTAMGHTVTLRMLKDDMPNSTILELRIVKGDDPRM